MREARAAEILELRKEREDVLDARGDGADPVCEAMREQATNEFPERPGPARLCPDEHAPVDAQVRDSGKKGGDGAEGGKAVAELDRQLADGGAVDVLQVRGEITREEKEIAKRLEAELRDARSARRAKGPHEGEVGDGEVLQVGQRALLERRVVCAGPRQILDARVCL